MRVTMVVISGLSNSHGLGFSFSLAMVSITAISMSIAVRVTMVVISGLSNSHSFGFSFSLAMVSISAISMSIAMAVVSWLSNSCTEEGKRNSNQEIHVLVGLNFSETPPC